MGENVPSDVKTETSLHICADWSVFPVSMWFEPRSGHMWESQVLLTDGQVVFLRVLRFSPTFDERSARYKWNILERAVKPKSKKKKKKNPCQHEETSLYIKTAPSKDSDQTAQMHMLI